MEIVVKMTPDEYDLFRLFQKEKADIEEELSSDYKKFMNKHEKICSALLEAVEEDSNSTEINPAFSIKKPDKLAEALDAANGWYA